MIPKLLAGAAAAIFLVIAATLVVQEMNKGIRRSKDAIDVKANEVATKIDEVKTAVIEQVQINSLVLDGIRFASGIEDAKARLETLRALDAQLTSELGSIKNSQKRASPLPDPLITTHAEYRNPTFVSLSDAGLKINHVGGVAVIPLGDLPEEVRKSLGASKMAITLPKVTLPDPLVTPAGRFDGPILLAVVPDGIRIRTKTGAAHINYEHLPSGLQTALGGFNAAAAIKYREEAAAIASMPVADETAASTTVTSSQTTVTQPGSSRDGEVKEAGPKRTVASISATSAGGVNAGEGATKRILIVSATSPSATPVKITVNCVWIVLTSARGDLGTQAAGSQTVTCGAGQTGQFQLTGTFQRNQGDKKGVRAAGGHYRGWAASAYDENGQKIGTIASMRDYERMAP